MQIEANRQTQTRSLELRIDIFTQNAYSQEGRRNIYIYLFCAALTPTTEVGSSCRAVVEKPVKLTEDSQHSPSMIQLPSSFRPMKGTDYLLTQTTQHLLNIFTRL